MNLTTDTTQNLILIIRITVPPYSVQPPPFQIKKGNGLSRFRATDQLKMRIGKLSEEQSTSLIQWENNNSGPLGEILIINSYGTITYSVLCTSLSTY